MTERTAGLRPTMRRILAERPLWLLLCLIVLYFARPLFLGQTFFFRDLTTLSFPQRVRLVELVRASRVPLWDPYLNGGQPFLGNLSNTALYPTALLYFPLPPITAFNLEIVLHFLLCALATYALARVLGLSQIAGFLAGAVFTLCGFTLSTANLFTKLLSLPYLVFLVLFSHLFFSERRFRWFVAAVLSGVLSIFGGAIEWSALAGAMVVVWALVYPYSETAPRTLARVGWCLLLAVSIVGVAGIQIFPAADVLRESTRATGLRFLPVSAWSLSPRRLPELIVPGFLGSTNIFNEKDYWGWRLEMLGLPLIVSIYWGIPTFALAVAGGVRRKGSLPRRVRRLLLAILAVALLLSLGQYLWLTPAVFRLLPGAGLLRYPVKFLVCALLPIALLAASAADAFETDSEFPIPFSRSTIRLLAALAVLLGILAATVAAGTGAAFERLFFLENLPPRLRPLLAARLVHEAVVTAGLALLLRLSLRGRARWHLSSLAVIVLLDIGLAGRSVNVFAPRGLLTEEPDAARIVRSELGGGRFFRDANPTEMPMRAPTNEIFWRFLWSWSTLDRYLANSFDIPVVFHEDYDSLASRRIVGLTSVLAKLPWERRIPLLSAGNVTTLVTPQELQISDLKLVGEIPNTGHVRFFVFKNLAAAPRVGFVSQWVPVTSETEALRSMLSGGFDPRRRVVLENATAETQLEGCAPGSVLELERRPTFSSYRVETACAGYVVFSEAFDGWRVSVDGTSQPLLRANVAFSAVRVSPGTHVIARDYRPVGLRRGLSISVVTGLLLVAAGVASRSRRGGSGDANRAQRRA